MMGRQTAVSPAPSAVTQPDEPQLLLIKPVQTLRLVWSLLFLFVAMRVFGLVCLAAMHLFPGVCGGPALRCSRGSSSCADGSSCFLDSHQCDGETDCSDGSDEENCAVNCTEADPCPRPRTRVRGSGPVSEAADPCPRQRTRVRGRGPVSEAADPCPRPRTRVRGRGPVSEAADPCPRTRVRGPVSEAADLRPRTRVRGRGPVSEAADPCPRPLVLDFSSFYQCYIKLY
uniref:Uncharacterized protein n=1 Tax=Knipowitschia caucasica TaxID=637954 RepID=A0AAV2MUH6_KNICA